MYRKKDEMKGIDREERVDGGPGIHRLNFISYSTGSCLEQGKVQIVIFTGSCPRVS